MTLIQCCDLSLGYEGKCVLSHLELSVQEGDYLAIVGENGAGKSTLHKGILGLIRPTGGHIHFHLPPKEIGYLPQQTPIQRDFPASVMEVVLSGLLAAKANRCYRELSGGQQQRVLLARALCAAGRLLLMDEPFTGLDPTVTNELYDVVDKLNHEQGVTVIMVTHDVPEALRHASRILHLGAEHFDGTAEEYRQSPLYRRLMGGDLNA